jgi:hypothetical protein
MVVGAFVKSGDVSGRRGRCGRIILVYDRRKQFAACGIPFRVGLERRSRVGAPSLVVAAPCRE